MGANGAGYEADERDNWAGALTLLDVFETFFGEPGNFHGSNLEFLSSILIKHPATAQP